MPKWTPVELGSGVALFVRCDGDFLSGAYFSKNSATPPAGFAPEDRADRNPLLRQAARELKDYMAGKRRVFSVPFELDGTEFQCRVWAELCKIPFGELATYASIAASVGKPKAVRAVGAANGRNPLPIIVPCHRVIASDGSLAGYSAGVEVKRLLLAREGITL